MFFLMQAIAVAYSIVAVVAMVISVVVVAVMD